MLEVVLGIKQPGEGSEPVDDEVVVFVDFMTLVTNDLEVFDGYEQVEEEGVKMGVDELVGEVVEGFFFLSQKLAEAAFLLL